jgi:hypothetical protein
VNSRARAALFGGLLAVAAPRLATAEPPDPDPRKFGFGLQVAVWGIPTSHLGIPVTNGGEGGVHLPAEFVFRWQLNQLVALNFAFGTTQGLGATIWAGGEVFTPAAGDRGRIVTLELYDDPGLQLGFAGPDWFARHENTFVGYLYTIEGPLEFALRFPFGARLHWNRIGLDTYVEAAPMLGLTPDVELLFSVIVGVRARF